MSSLPKWKSEVSNSVENFDTDLSGLKTAIISPNICKIRHLRSLEINQLSLNRYEGVNLAGARPFNNDDKSMCGSHQRLSALQTKSTYDLRNTDGSLSGKNRANSDLNVSKVVSANELVSISSDAVERQLKNQEFNKGFYHKTFYTLNNFMDIDHPFFISRIFGQFSKVEDDFDLRVNKTSFTLNLYMQRNECWKLFKQYHIKLSLLVNIGDDIVKIEENCNVPNMILLKLSDGCYYTIPNPDLNNEKIYILQCDYSAKVEERLANTKIREKTCSYDQTMKMNNYSRCIYDLILKKHELQNRIIKFSECNMKLEQIKNKIKNFNFLIEGIFGEFEREKKHNHELTFKLESLKLKLANQLNNKEHDDFNNKKALMASKTANFNISTRHLLNEFNIEKAKIANVLLTVFPIEQNKTSNGKYDFFLFKYKLPNALTLSYSMFRLTFFNGASAATKVELIKKLSQLSNLNIEKLNALIGFIALIINTLSTLLKIPLRYPINYRGSNSYINDPISSLKSAVGSKENYKNINGSNANNTKNNIYPLFSSHNPSLNVRFTYGLLLLRKNLEQLFELENLAKVEDFNLLASCKILLTCISGYEIGRDQEEEDENLGNLNDELSKVNSSSSNAIWISSNYSLNNNMTAQSNGNHNRKLSGSSIKTVKSRTVKEYNEQIQVAERINLIKNNLRKYTL